MSVLAALFWSWALFAEPARAAPDPLALARAQFDRGDYAAAIGVLSSALEMTPHGGQLWHWRSRCYLELRNYDNAIADGERAVAESPADSEYRRWLGRAYGSAAEERRSFLMARKVRQTFEQAVHLDPSNIAARRDLMQFYLEAPGIVGGGERKALAQADAIAQLDPVDGHLARGAYWAGRKRFDLADAEYRRVIDARPDRIGPCLEVAEYAESRGDAGTLADAVEQATGVATDDIRLAYYNGVLLVLAKHNPAEANRSLRAYLAAAPRRSDLPSHSAAHTWLGRLAEQQGQVTVAIDEYRAALAIDPDATRARAALERITRSESRGGRP
jgi:tetratricopeptide (TPR) repeat protein